MEYPNCGLEFEEGDDVFVPRTLREVYNEEYLPNLKEGEVPMSREEFFEYFNYFNRD